MFGILDDDLDGLTDEDLQALALRSLLQNRRRLALADYAARLEQDAFLNEFPQAAELFDRVAAAEMQAFAKTMRF